MAICPSYGVADNSVLGSDVDGELHGGIGAKAYVTGEPALRLDGAVIPARGPASTRSSRSSSLPG